ncbi:PQQ-dependent sugar dehydrogenase [Dactylosporangium sp. CA-052675]|uniref:PQQ-dependent sugar dehydrogenase n=1 Tax=Dactylosporangium sp. CA-052675 TaxID=3239927 RepID=UPI003D8E0BCB
MPNGFQEQVVFSGLTQPTSIQFASDGRVFVAQKNGVIKVFAGLSATSGTVFADLSAKVHDYWDRGLLGFALSPTFPDDPSVYVLYTYDAPPKKTAPVWHDDCDPVPGGGAGGNCVVTGRLSKLTAAGNQWTGTETTLIDDWCQQFPSHSIGDLHFGADGALYASSGDGASFGTVDYGQFGSPVNPCGDPAGEGGALRSQGLRSTGDPLQYDGSILRVDPANPAAAKPVGFGLRNPFRFTIRPGTNEIWAGDVGWNSWEEINRIPAPSTSSPVNFGWPCFEGAARQPGYEGANLGLCNSLYASGGQTSPYYTYNHANQIVPGEACPSGGSSITGVAFYPGGGSYPSAYNGALFFADYARGCIWAMFKGANGQPDPTQIQTFLAGAAYPAYLTMGPGNDLYYVDLVGGTVRRIRYFPTNRPPVASFTATPTSGTSPLVAQFDASASTDADVADQSQLTYQWDFDGDGKFDATGVKVSHTYDKDGSYTAILKVTDPLGASGTATTTITAGAETPTAVIDSPEATVTWAVGDTVRFSGHAYDPQTKSNLPDSALKWELQLEHCTAPDNCHTHFLQTFDGVSSGSFKAPDHEYPSYLRLKLSATNDANLTSVATVDLQPKTVELSFASKPTGLQVVVGSSSQATPFTRRVIVGSTNTVSAPAPQTTSTMLYSYGNWSDNGAQTHTLTAPSAATTYTATYNGVAPIELRANANGNYVTADNGGKAPLIANRTAIGAWEQFDVIDQGGGFVALRSRSNLQYVTAENGGNAPLIANRPTVGPWEKFELIDNGDGTISLKANANGNYVTAENGGNAALIANRTAIGAWEKFTRVKAPTTVSVTAYINNLLVTAESSGTKPLIANRGVVGAWETFDIVDAGDGYVALLAHANSRYVTAESAGGKALIANRTAVGAWEKFQMVTNADGTVSFKANANGRYVTAENGGGKPLIANRTEIGAWEKFSIAPA